MAKLKAPLLSFGASGAIAKAVVYFPWKGLNVAREYVIPANPKTLGQTTQRGYLTDAVAAIHSAMAEAERPLDEGETMAYALLGSTFPTPRTWFNVIVKQWLDQKVAGKIPIVCRGGSLTPGVDEVGFRMWIDEESDDITDGNIHYGTSKTALIHTAATTPAQMEAGRIIDGLTTGVKYYFQFRATLPETFLGARSGIYYAVPD